MEGTDCCHRWPLSLVVGCGNDAHTQKQHCIYFQDVCQTATKMPETVDMKKYLTFGGKTGGIGQMMAELVKKEGAHMNGENMSNAVIFNERMSSV